MALHPPPETGMQKRTASPIPVPLGTRAARRRRRPPPWGRRSPRPSARAGPARSSGCTTAARPAREGPPSEWARADPSAGKGFRYVRSHVRRRGDGSVAGERKSARHCLVRTLAKYFVTAIFRPSMTARITPPKAPETIAARACKAYGPLGRRIRMFHKRQLTPPLIAKTAPVQNPEADQEVNCQQ